MSDYRWPDSPYTYTPPKPNVEQQVYKKLEILDRALIRIALGNESAEYMQHIAAQALMESNEIPSRKENT